MATTTSWSGAINLNTIHVEVGEGSSGTTCTIGDADIRNRMGYGSVAVSFYNFYKSWGTSVTHSNASVASSKYNSAHTVQGYTQGIIFSAPAMGSVSDGSIAASAVASQTLWLDTFVSRSDLSYNYLIIHDGAIQAGGGVPVAPLETDPFRANKISRICWNDYQQTKLTTPAPAPGYLYLANSTYPGSGTYDLGIQWSTGA